jgi:hypothetical protein
MRFTLSKRSSNRVRSTFHVLNSAGDVVGSINVAPSEEADLLRHWAGPTVQPQASAAVSRSSGDTNAFVAALMRNKTPMSRVALLRS